VFAKRRLDLQRKLRDAMIESNQVHYRNDRYTTFRASRGHFPNTTLSDSMNRTTRSNISYLYK
jgi:hypothetical protein